MLAVNPPPPPPLCQPLPPPTPVHPPYVPMSHVKSFVMCCWCGCECSVILVFFCRCDTTARNMDRSIRYVREHKVAPLLNDMLTHLLLSQASDPLSALITYLEKKHAKDQRANGGSIIAPTQAAAGTAASVTSASRSAVVDVSELVGLDKIVAEILRSEHNAQLQVERVAATLPKSALAAQPLLERFHKNSQLIAALAQQLAELHRGSATVAAAVQHPSSSSSETAMIADTDASPVDRIRSEALQLEKRLSEWLKNGDAAKAPAATEMVARAIRQQETLLALLSQV